MFQMMTTRALINVLSQYPFGTAMDDDTRVLKEHHNRVVAVAAANRKVINLNLKTVSELDQTFMSFYNTQTS